MVAALKLPVLNPGEFELWKMRIEQYFLMTNYALWEVIVNGDSPPPIKTVDGVSDSEDENETKTKSNWRKPSFAKVEFVKPNEQVKTPREIVKQEEHNKQAKHPRKNSQSPRGEEEKKDAKDPWNKDNEVLSQNSQNVAFVSSNSPGSTSQAHSSNFADTDTLSDALIYFFFANQSNSPQLDNEDLRHLDSDDLEEKDLKDNALTELRKKFEKAEKERDDLKLTFEKFENSSKNLGKLLDSQVCDKFKTDVGFDSQQIDSLVNDRYKTGVGNHAVSPPYTRNFMPPKPNLILADIDEYVVSESITSVPAVVTNEARI
nr:hypothetical protein [Tanacetum cinerariifolium]